MTVIACTFLLLASILDVNAANILFIFPVPSPSHQILGNELAKAAVKNGHHVTMITATPLGEKLQNYTEIVVEEMKEYKESKQNHDTHNTLLLLV